MHLPLLALTWLSPNSWLDLKSNVSFSDVHIPIDGVPEQPPVSSSIKTKKMRPVSLLLHNSQP